MKSEPESKVFYRNYTVNIHGRLLDLTTPGIMGILNVTPDSFFDGGRYTDEKSILLRAEEMLTQGATILDIGAYSTRPGASEVAVEEELRRVVFAIRAIRTEFPEAILSIDTFRGEVARAAIGEGAGMINDVSGGNLDPEMFKTVASLSVPYVLMHMRGTPVTMSKLTAYENVVFEVIADLQMKVQQLEELGVKDILIDPGFGFAKTIEQNYEMLRKLDLFSILERPLLIGLSRKSMVWKRLQTTAENALNGTTVLHTLAMHGGVSIFRVHDVREASEVIQLSRLSMGK